MDKQPSSRMCFVCGVQNPIGLKLAFYQDPDAGQVRATFTVPDVYQGYPGVVHGGIVAAVLDEVAGRAVMLHRPGEEGLMVTLRLTIRYRHPTPTETPLTAVGWVEQIGGIGARVAGQIRLPDGTVTAECESLLGPVPESFRASWEEEKAYWKVYPEEV